MYLFIIYINLNFKYTDKEILIFPINQNNVHWTILVVDKQKNSILHLDPLMGRSVQKTKDSTEKLLSNLKKCKFINKSAKLLQVTHARQQNTWSCGVFILMVIHLHIVLNLLVCHENLSWAPTELRSSR